jgi:cardiolipin synthase
MNVRRAALLLGATCVQITPSHAQLSAASPLEEQARQTLFAEGKIPPKRDFLKTTARATIEACIRKPITTFRLGKATYWRRGMALLEDNLPIQVPRGLPGPPPPKPGTPEFSRHLDQMGLPSPTSGTLEYHVGGAAFFKAFETEIAAARQSIDVQVFIFDNDDVSVRCADLLRGRAGEIPVRVLIDDLGSTFAHGRNPPSGLPEGFVQPADIAQYIVEDSEVHVRQTLNPWLVTDHTKLHLFDDKVAFIGGMNLGRESRHEWHDLMVGVRGPIIAHLQRDFDTTWERMGPRGDFALLDEPEPLDDPADTGVPLRILRTDAVDGRSEILVAMLEAIRGAEERIWIEMPYFAADVIENELEAAAERGVDVRLILPNRANHGIMDAGNIVTARNLIRAGVKVYHYPKMTHLKAMICDNWATIGSANLDTISLRINRELNLSFADPTLIQQLEQSVFAPDFAASKQLRLEETELLLGPLIESIADQL